MKSRLKKAWHVLRMLGVCSSLFCGSIQGLVAQEEPQVVQFSGFVFLEDSLSGAIGAHIYQRTTRRGTSTDFYGWFSLAVAEKDTFLVSYQGYEPKKVVIPFVEGDSYSLLIYLTPSITELPIIEVNAYMNERQFKAAVIAFNQSRNPQLYLPEGSQRSLQNHSALNYAYFVQQQRQQRDMRYSPSYVPLTNILFGPLIDAIRSKKKKKR